MKASNMQIILLVIFFFFGIVGVLVFAVYGGSSSSNTNETGGVIWGTLPQDAIQEAQNSINFKSQGALSFEYIEKPSDSFETDLVNAIADGKGPDAVIVPQYLLIKLQNKIVELPWSLYSERQFRDSFLEGSEIFLSSTGIMAFPVAVDPMVLFWNRDIFTKNNQLTTPKFWQDVAILASSLTEKTENKLITKSAISLGEYQNVPHAKEIFALFDIQAGAPMVTKGEAGYDSNILTSVFNPDINPSIISLDFFTQFANPSKDLYSWNRSLLSADKFFLRGNLAMYLGFASEIPLFRDQNPNLNFDVAMVPQIKGGPKNITYANIYGAALLASAKLKNGAFKSILQMTGIEFQKALADKSGLPPVRRDLLSTLPGRASGDVIYKSASIAKTWLDPDYKKTNDLVKNMIESVNSGIVNSEQSIADFSNFLKEILGKH